MKRYGHIVEKIVSHSNLSDSYDYVMRGKKRKTSRSGRYIIRHKEESLNQSGRGFLTALSPYRSSSNTLSTSEAKSV